MLREQIVFSLMPRKSELKKRRNQESGMEEGMKLAHALNVLLTNG